MAIITFRVNIDLKQKLNPKNWTQTQTQTLVRHRSALGSDLGLVLDSGLAQTWTQPQTWTQAKTQT